MEITISWCYDKINKHQEHLANIEQIAKKYGFKKTEPHEIEQDWPVVYYEIAGMSIFWKGGQDKVMTLGKAFVYDVQKYFKDLDIVCNTKIKYLLMWKIDFYDINSFMAKCHIWMSSVRIIY